MHSAIWKRIIVGSSTSCFLDLRILGNLRKHHCKARHRGFIEFGYLFLSLIKIIWLRNTQITFQKHCTLLYGNNNGLFDRSTGWLHYLQFKINDNIYDFLKKIVNCPYMLLSRILLSRREMKQLKLPDSLLGGTLSVHWVQKSKNCLIRYNFNRHTMPSKILPIRW